MKLILISIREIFLKYGIFLLPLLIILPGINDFPYPGYGGNFSDFALTHFPNAIFLQHSLREGILPLWSPALFGGNPFIAHPYSGIWNPLFWPFLLFSMPLGLNLFIAFHLLIAGIATYLLLIEMGIERPAAILGALTFALSPKLFAHYGAGHLMLISAVCLTPLLFWVTVRRPTGKWKDRVFYAGTILALIFLTDPRWALYAGGAWVFWMFAHSHNNNLLLGAKKIFKHGLLALIIVAPALWLFSEFSLLSSRYHLTIEDTLILSLPLQALWDLLIPNWGGYFEWVFYWGIIPLVLIILSVIATITSRRNRYWLILFVIGIYLSLGSNIWGSQWLAQMPGFSQLRVPPRALFLSAFAGAVLVAIGWEYLQNKIKRANVQKINLGAFALFILLLGMGIALFVIDAPRWPAAFFASGMLLVFWLGLQLFQKRKLLLHIFFSLCLALIIIDLGVMDASLINFREKAVVLNKDEKLASYLADQQGFFRTYSPSYSLAQQNAAIVGIEKIDGVDPLQLSSFIEYFQEASGISTRDYSVSMPGYSSGQLALEHQSLSLDTNLLGLMNVRYVISEFSIDENKLNLLAIIDDSFVYENEDDMGRAWLIPQNGDPILPVQISVSPNEIMLAAHGPGLLVLSEIFYPGWEAWVNGNKAEIIPYKNLLRSVEIGDGEQLVEFRYRPPALTIALPISFLLIIFLLFQPNIFIKDKE